MPTTDSNKNAFQQHFPAPLDSPDCYATSCVHLPTPALQHSWDQALRDIARATTSLGLLHQVAFAQGFVWALEVAELLSYAQTTALHAVIGQAERATFPRLAGSPQ